MSSFAFYSSTSKLIQSFMQCPLPKNLMLRKVKFELETKFKDFDVVLVGSGRSALHVILSNVKNSETSKERCEVLIPDYICNVVDKSVIKSKLVPTKYATDEYFRPIIADLSSKASEKTIAAIFAPIFGSYDSVFLQAAELVKKKTNSFVIFDNAQCIDTKPPPETDAVVLSFNNKDIWGVMGGAILIKRNLRVLQFKVEHLTFHEELRYLNEFLKRVCNMLLWKASIRHFEYSTCSRFPYEIDQKTISKISLAFALLGLKELEFYKGKRRRNYLAIESWCEELKGIQIIKTANVSISCFIPIAISGNIEKALSVFDDLKIQIKMPYAVDNNPKLSIRENIIALANNPSVKYSEIFRFS